MSVERSFGLLNRSRCLWCVCKAVLQTFSAMTHAARAFTLMRRIAREAQAQ